MDCLTFFGFKISFFYSLIQEFAKTVHKRGFKDSLIFPLKGRKV